MPRQVLIVALSDPFCIRIECPQCGGVSETVCGQLTKVHGLGECLHCRASLFDSEPNLLIEFQAVVTRIRQTKTKVSIVVPANGSDVVNDAAEPGFRPQAAIPSP